MNDSTICIDTNLIVRFVARAGDTAVDEAWERWRSEESRFVAPLLMRYEMVNAIDQMSRLGGVSAEESRQVLESALAVPVGYQHEFRDHEQALELAQRFGVRSACDAHYLALAERLGFEFWTRDERIVNAVRPHLSWVRLVSERTERLHEPSTSGLPRE
jgi:predicted nucleic acid-binding protein